MPAPMPVTIFANVPGFSAPVPVELFAGTAEQYVISAGDCKSGGAETMHVFLLIGGTV